MSAVPEGMLGSCCCRQRNRCILGGANDSLLGSSVHHRPHVCVRMLFVMTGRRGGCMIRVIELVHEMCEWAAKQSSGRGLDWEHLIFGLVFHRLFRSSFGGAYLAIAGRTYTTAFSHTADVGLSEIAESMHVCMRAHMWTRHQSPRILSNCMSPVLL